MKNKFNTELCTNDMTFQDCELAILRHAVDESQKQSSTKIANDEEIQKMKKDFISYKESYLVG